MASPNVSGPVSWEFRHFLENFVLLPALALCCGLVLDVQSRIRSHAGSDDSQYLPRRIMTSDRRRTTRFPVTALPGDALPAAWLYPLYVPTSTHPYVRMSDSASKVRSHRRHTSRKAAGHELAVVVFVFAVGAFSSRGVPVGRQSPRACLQSSQRSMFRLFHFENNSPLTPRRETSCSSTTSVLIDS